MKKPKKAKAKEAEFNMPMPHPPVSAMFTVDGLMLTVIEGKKIYYKTLSWKELHKLGKKGKKVTPPQMVQDMTSKLDEMMASRAKSDADRQKALDELKRKYSTPVRIPRVEPVPPVMPVPPYRPTVQSAPVPPAPELDGAPLPPRPSGSDN